MISHDISQDLAGYGFVSKDTSETEVVATQLGEGARISIHGEVRSSSELPAGRGTSAESKLSSVW